MALKIFDTTNAVSAGDDEYLVEKVPTTLICTGLGAGETVGVHVSIDGGANWQPLTKDGANVEFTDTNTTIAVYSPMRLSFSKAATAGSVGVYASRKWDL